MFKRFYIVNANNANQKIFNGHLMVIKILMVISRSLSCERCISPPWGTWKGLQSMSSTPTATIVKSRVGCFFFFILLGSAELNGCYREVMNRPTGEIEATIWHDVQSHTRGGFRSWTRALNNSDYLPALTFPLTGRADIPTRASRGMCAYSSATTRNPRNPNYPGKSVWNHAIFPFNTRPRFRVVATE